MMYRCMKCGKDVKVEPKEKRIRCPFCGYKVLIKQRSGVAKTIKAR
jgi:DNA-directed RNA polymerase subunit P